VRFLAFQGLNNPQPRPEAAIGLTHKQPVRWTHKRIAVCDGGGGPLGHPRIFINTDKPEICNCTYCGLPFVSMLIHWKLHEADPQIRPTNTTESILNLLRQHIPSKLKDTPQKSPSPSVSQMRLMLNDKMLGNGVMKEIVHTRMKVFKAIPLELLRKGRCEFSKRCALEFNDSRLYWHPTMNLDRTASNLQLHLLTIQLA
jgi:uncharacterized Zn-finger protein